MLAPTTSVPRAAAVQVADCLARPRERREDAHRVILEDPSRLGERHRPPAPVEESSAEPPLQLTHVLGERGLAQVQAVRRASETPGPCHRQEHLELAHRRIHKLEPYGPDKNTVLAPMQPPAYRWSKAGSGWVLVQSSVTEASPWSPRVTRR